MHKINVLTLGLKNFNISLNELKGYLNFELTTTDNDLEKIAKVNDYDLLLIHEEYLKNKHNLDLLKKINITKIFVISSDKLNNDNSIKLLLPTTLKDINQIVEDTIVKKNFNKNSSIKIKDYTLDKNEKKLFKKNDFILLTEKEIQLLELFLKYDKAISRDKILHEVWKYASEADTHTVETHIYRLRKKIKNKFSDEKFILNDKTGYLF